MIDKNKIAKAARQIPEKVADAKWAINEFLKDLWHQTNKEPEGYDEWILLHIV